MILFGVGLAIILVALFYQRRVDTQLRDIHELLNENVHLGMTRAEIDSFLDRQGIAHSFAADKEPTKRPDRPRAELALLRGNSDGNIVRTDYQIRFNFDSSGRLTSYSVKEVFTGP